MNLETRSVLTLLIEKLTSWYEMAVKMLPNFLVAIIALFLFIFIAKIARTTSRKMIKNFTRNKAALELLNTIIYIFILSIGLFVALEILSLDKAVASILAGAGVIGLALGFAFQEIASNFVSGVLIAFIEPYKLGDIVEVDNYLGEVINISLRTTSIMTFQGLEVLIPNKYMFTKPLTNYTTTPKRRIDLQVGISYGDDLEKVEKIAKDALEPIQERIKGQPIEVFFEEFGASSINFTARIWVNYPGNNAYLRSRHQAVINIKKAFDKHNICIPFPIRTLDFGIRGGEKLSEMLKHNNV